MKNQKVVPKQKGTVTTTAKPKITTQGAKKLTPTNTKQITQSAKSQPVDKPIASQAKQTSQPAKTQVVQKPIANQVQQVPQPKQSQVTQNPIQPERIQIQVGNNTPLKDQQNLSQKDKHVNPIREMLILPKMENQTNQVEKSQKNNPLYQNIGLQAIIQQYAINITVQRLIKNQEESKKNEQQEQHQQETQQAKQIENQPDQKYENYVEKKPDQLQSKNIESGSNTLKNFSQNCVDNVLDSPTTFIEMIKRVDFKFLLKIVCKSDQLSNKVQKHLSEIFILLATCAMCCAFGISISFELRFLANLFFLPFMVFLLIYMYDEKRQEGNRYLCLCIFSFVLGFLIGHRITSPWIAVISLLGTTVLFFFLSSLSIVSYQSFRRFIASWISHLVWVLITVIIIGKVYGSEENYIEISAFSIFSMSVFLIYATQVIIEEAENAKGNLNLVSNTLYLFFVTFIIFIISFVAIKIGLQKNEGHEIPPKKNKK